ncbi:MAG: carboxypeptidase-like regulatory domain-containing protein [Planctomycetota bacterium]|jgi:hypothetical protein
MRRLLFVLPVFLMGGVLWYVYSDTGSRKRAPSRPAAVGVRPGDRLRALPQGDWTEPGPERPEPAVLRGRVFNVLGEPVDRAEVAVLWPKPYQLTFTRTAGRYELRFERPGRYLLEARLTLDLARSRPIVEIPAEGDPSPLDFHLEAAGIVFGEAAVEEAPLRRGAVDMGVIDLFGDAQWVQDTECENGVFSFYWKPPRDVPLRVVIRSLEGFMEKPVELRYEGRRVDLGRIHLTRYPTLKVKMRLPAGKYAAQVHAGYARDLRPELRQLAEESVWDDALPTHVWDDGLPTERLAENSHVLIRKKHHVTERLVFWDRETGRYRVIRDVELLLDQMRELEVAVRPGPLTVRRRLTDEHGRPLRARVAFETGPPAETDAEGLFAVTLPHTGVFTLHLTALHDPDHGWIPLPRSSRRPWNPFLLDTDDPRSACTLPLDGHLLVVTERTVVIVTDGGRFCWKVGAPDGELIGALTPVALEAGRYRWSPGDVPSEDWHLGTPFDVGESGVTVLDVR